MKVGATRRSLQRVLPLAVCLGILAFYLIAWLGISDLQTGRSDFTNTYVGALLLRRGEGPSIYSQSLQTPLYLQLIAPLRVGALPFIDAPLAAAVALPFTFLSLHTAYRLWSLLQLLLIAMAAAIAVRSAPRGRLGLRQLVTVALVAFSCVGSATTLILGQWDGVSALGVALLYAWMRQGRMAAAGAVLAVTSLMAKPQLALGLAAFVIGRNDRRLWLGALGGTAVSVALSLLLVGPAGLASFVGAVLHSIGVWPPTTMISLVSIAGTVLGNGPAAHAAAAIGSVLLMAVAAGLGFAVRQRPERLEAGLAGAVVLSLLAAPHAYSQDVALLVPAAAWSITAAAADGGVRSRLLPAAIGAWFVVNAAVFLNVVTQAAIPAGVLTPWALLVAAALAGTLCMRQGRRPGEITVAVVTAAPEAGREVLSSG